ncbi:MAG: toll/interleukin-1 receptor domain-containing protein [Nodosilinea sp.]
MSQKVFVSYHKDNNLAVEKLHDDLQKRGIKIWLDAKDIKPGQPKRESLLKGIIDSDFFSLPAYHLAFYRMHYVGLRST